MKKTLKFLKEIFFLFLSIFLSFLLSWLINLSPDLMDMAVGSLGRYWMQIISTSLLPIFTIIILKSLFNVEKKIYNIIIYIFFILVNIGLFFYGINSGYIPEVTSYLLGSIEMILPIIIPFFWLKKEGFF